MQVALFCSFFLYIELDPNDSRRIKIMIKTYRYADRTHGRRQPGCTIRLLGSGDVDLCAIECDELVVALIANWNEEDYRRFH